MGVSGFRVPLKGTLGKFLLRLLWVPLKEIVGVPLK